MLVLERREQEGFWLDEHTYVKVISIGKRRVKIGIEAPAGVIVTRGELRTAAASTNSDDGHTQQVLPGRRRQQ
jgi:carbon storage regulator CsrA